MLGFLANSHKYQLLLEDKETTKEELDKMIKSVLSEMGFLCEGDNPFGFVDNLYSLIYFSSEGDDFPFFYDCIPDYDLERGFDIGNNENDRINLVVELFVWFESDATDKLFDMIVANYIPKFRIKSKDASWGDKFNFFMVKGFIQAIVRYFEFLYREDKELLMDTTFFYDYREKLHYLFEDGTENDERVIDAIEVLFFDLNNRFKIHNHLIPSEVIKSSTDEDLFDVLSVQLNGKRMYPDMEQ